MISFIKKSFAIFSSILIIFLGVSFAYLYQKGIETLPLRQYFPDDNTVAVWDWSNPTTRDNRELRELADYLYLRQVNTVYVDVSLLAYADADLRMNTEESLVRYVKAMQRRGISTFASSGDVDWSKPQLRHIPLQIQKFAFEFNNKHPDSKLAGVEFDIESYNQDGFPESSNTEKTIVLTELLDTIYKLTDEHRKYVSRTSDQIEIGFAVPYWFDNQNGNIPSVTWQGKTGPTIFHILDTLNQANRANIVVMAYRNGSQGSDGTIFHSRSEVEYAHSMTPNVKVIIGQEVTDVEPEKITFFGQTHAELTSEVNVFAEEFKNMRSYGGVAINDLAGLQEMSRNE